MDTAYRFKRAVQLASRDMDAIQGLCQAKINEVAKVRKLRAIGDVSMLAQCHIDVCHYF
ncbi:hypothetical protein I5L56_09465 [Pseudomonas oryzihabitans]|uniref:hypothetical protein n=1 Tax=Pseudomonas oryzihabitans TaxID=47885 RepID=UPI0018D87165|nr:hypothetical protein [Pseudomonas oryzihabitans]MBH3329850.1 hypothetical protein [Pseudomonas oryzihabitans]